MQSLGKKINSSVVRDISPIAIAFLGGKLLGGFMKSKFPDTWLCKDFKNYINSDSDSNSDSFLDALSAETKKALCFTTVNIITHLTMNPFIILGGYIALGCMAESLDDKKKQEKEARAEKAEEAKRNKEMIALIDELTGLKEKISALTELLNSTHSKND